jgi:CRP-like cAMP-binding protein
MFNKRNTVNRNYIEALRRSEVFARCGERELRAIASLATPLDVRAGRVLTRQGNPGVQCFVVLDGHAVVERDGVIIGHAVGGSMIGEMAMMGREPRCATVTAATDMLLLVWSRSEFTAIRALGIGIETMQPALDHLVSERRTLLAEAPQPVGVGIPL